MINLIPSKQDNYQFHNDNKIENEEAFISANLSSISQSEIEKKFIQYETFFSINKLEYLVQHFPSVIPADKRDSYIDVLYKNSCSDETNSFFKVNNSITTKEGEEVIVCPFCEYDTKNTLDHFIPKKGAKGYAEFCDMPLNLIPMCGDCNRHKGTTWVDQNNHLFFVNLYRDKIPDVIFLKVDITIIEASNNLELNFSFFDDNIKDKELAKRLYNTYDKLQILKKYNKIGKMAVVEIEKCIKKNKSKSSKQEIKDILLKEVENDNCYRNIIRLACVNNSFVFDFLYDKN